jgi:Mlc titration factor MtfA (ptsG expression regulator)
MGLFCSPYGATSIQEYFANGFEKYFTESPQYVKKISPVMYQKVVEVINDDEA